MSEGRVTMPQYPRITLGRDDESLIILNKKKILRLPSLVGEIQLSPICSIQVMAKGEFEQLALYLPDRYDYMLGVDQSGRRMLVVMEKSKIVNEGDV